MRQEPPPTDPPCVGDWRGFHTELRRAAVAATQTGMPMSLLMLELAGQPPADRAGTTLPRLDALADVIRTAVGRRGALARYAEERLAVIMTETHLGDAIIGAERIGQSLSRSPTSSGLVTGGAMPAVPAIGVAQFHDDESLNHLIERVAEALERAKAGRTLIAVADHRMRRRSIRRQPCAAGEPACLCGLCGQ